MKIRSTSFLISIALLMPYSKTHADDTTSLPDFSNLGYFIYNKEKLRASNVENNGNFKLSNNKTFKLEGITLNNKGKKTLSSAINNKDMTIWVNKNHIDRHQRNVGQVITNHNTWLQCELLKAGQAITNTTQNSKKITKDLYNCENPNIIKQFQVKSENASSAIGKYTIVTGKIYSTYQSQKNFFINFDKDWKTDFSVMINNKIMKQCAPTILEKFSTGQTIKVRGWVEKYNGPIIKLTHCEQIEL
ncbi:MAG: hypothetical protein GY804_05295 [Alphaproteobacteria bacterium]|nr:hypothetical protein [Alphaproteobacteria bacterium]